MLQSTMMNTPLTLNLILERAGKLYKDVAITSRLPDRSLHRYTYGDMTKRARQLAQALSKAGVQPGDRIATLMWNHYAHLECYFGIPAIGAVLHTLNLRLHPDDIAYIAGHAEDRFLIIDDSLLPLFEEFRDRVNFEKVIVFSFAGDEHQHEDYDEFLDTADGDFELPELDEYMACGMCYTSGTTGKPKGVVYGHRSSVLHTMGMSLPDSAGLSVRDAVSPVVPMFHAMAWGLPYAAAMVGARQVLPGPHLDPESLLDLYQETGTTFTAGVPTVWMRILEELDRAPDRWALKPRMRMFVGGSATPPSMVEAFEKYNLEVQAVWGLTETSPIASVSVLRPELEEAPADDQYFYRAQAGIPLPLVDTRVMTEDGEAPWDGKTVGDLQVRGPWITGCYYRRPDAADSFTDDGWFDTGDVAYMTPEGYIHISDRNKDLIKSGGEWISSVELENELMAHPDVAEAVVVAVSHPTWMERPLGVIVPRDGARIDRETLTQHLQGKFADWWLPNDYAFVDEIPKTSTGKFMKLKLREQFSDWQWPEK